MQQHLILIGGKGDGITALSVVYYLHMHLNVEGKIKSGDINKNFVMQIETKCD